MTAISEFCMARGVSSKIEELFTSYCRSTYAEKFSLMNGDTVKLIVSRMTEDQVLDAWTDFVSEMRSIIESPASG